MRSRTRDIRDRGGREGKMPPMLIGATEGAVLVMTRKQQILRGKLISNKLTSPLIVMFEKLLSISKSSITHNT